MAKREEKPVKPSAWAIEVKRRAEQAKLQNEAARDAEEVAKRAERAKRPRREATPENIREELRRIAFFDPKALFDSDGVQIPINELPDDISAVIAGLDVTELYGSNTDADQLRIGITKKYRLADKIKCLQLLSEQGNPEKNQDTLNMLMDAMKKSSTELC